VFQPGSRFNDLSDWNFAAIAASLGGHGERVTTQRALRDALGRAAARAGAFAGPGDAAARRALEDAGAVRPGFQAARDQNQKSVISHQKGDLVLLPARDCTTLRLLFEGCPCRSPRCSCQSGDPAARRRRDAFALGVVQLAAPKAPAAPDHGLDLGRDHGGGGRELVLDP
jgi:hypothetical protein